MESQKKHTPVYSFEFFPPKNEDGEERLRRTRERLSALGPRFFSVTFGAGGSTRERTFETVVDIQKRSGIDAAPHLSCIDATPDSIRDLLQRYRDNGIRDIVALRGDMPEDSDGGPGHFQYANELVEFIRKEHGDYFRIEVGCYPEIHPDAPDAFTDVRNFKRKVDAGADSAMTQYFFAEEAYYEFVNESERMGVDIPIVPGIMPIVNFQQLARFSDACGADIPRWLRRRLEVYQDDKESLQAFGIDVVTRLCANLLEAGAPGLHFYTLNQFRASEAIWHNLGLSEKIAAQAD